MSELASGAATAIDQASRKGWVETLVVLAFIAAYLGLAWVVRAWLIQAEKRETRMAARIDLLEDYQRNTLHDLVLQNTKAIAELIAALNARPCMSEDAVVQEVLRRRHKGGAI